jgi:transglutaminase-like putative cysteine protease
MKFKIFSELSYEVFSPTTFIFNIHAARSASQLILEESFLIKPDLSFEEFSLDTVDARFVKIAVNKGVSFTITYDAIVDVQYKVIEETGSLQEIPVMELEREIIPFLFPSRHCQSDKLRKLALKEFGKLENAYAKVVAINEWIFKHTDYITGVTDSGTSAFDTIIQSEGVCKDFAHLGIALCRALDIPARYVTGYAYKIFPPDFHACFEAYIGGTLDIF